MTQCVILWRNTQNDKVCFIGEDDGDNIAVFDHHDAAVAAVPGIPVLRVFPYQIVELDEL